VVTEPKLLNSELEVNMTPPTWLKRIWRGFLQTISLWFVAIGTACMILAYLNSFGASDKFNELLKSFGSAILVAGVFAVLLKSFQFLGVFSEELNKILYDRDDLLAQKRLREVIREEARNTLYDALYDPEETPPVRLRQVFREELVSSIYSPTLLARQSDIEEIWKMVSKVLYNSKFPEISNQIEETILRTYFPTKINYYYETFAKDVDMRPLSDQPDYFTATERYSYTVKSADSSQLVIPYSAEIIRKEGDSSDYNLLSISINGEDKTDELRSQLLKCTDNPGKLLVKFNIPLQGEREYKVIINQEKIYTPFVDNTDVFSSSKFINNLELDLRHPEHLIMTFFPMGTPQEFNSEVTSKTRIWQTYRGLIFPKQGYRILMFRR